MKKTIFSVMFAMVLGMMVGSCGNKTTGAATTSDSDTVVVDSDSVQADSVAADSDSVVVK